MRLPFALFLAVCLSAQPALSQEGPADLPSRGTEFENPAETYASDIISKADQMIQTKDYSGAAMLLMENFDRLSRLRASFFGKMLSLHLAQDNVQEARQFYLQYAKDDPELARAGIDKVYSYYVQKKDSKAAIEWTGQLMDLPPPDDLKPRVFAWQYNAFSSAGLTAEERALVKNCVVKFKTETCRAIFSSTTAALIASGKYDDASRLLDLIERERQGDNLRSMVIAEKTRIFFLKKQWKEGEAFLLKKTADLSNDDLAGLISFIASKAQNNEEFDAVDRMSMFVIKRQKGNNRAGNEAAACSLNILKKNNKISEIPSRLEQLMAMGLASSTLYSFYCEYFYTVIILENRDLSNQMIAIGEKLNAKLDNPDDKKQMILLFADGYFTLGDYKRSLQIIDANEKCWQKDWLDASRAKIGAHLAMQNKNYKEAVDGFRKYNDYIAKENIAMRDPVTDLIYTREMLLGFNALRIGNILRDNLKDEDGARKAYDEAEQYLKQAAGEAKPNSKESEYIDQQMAQLALHRKK